MTNQKLTIFIRTTFLMTVFLVMLLVIFLFSFNPIKDRQFIEDLQSILSKVQQAETTKSFSEEELKFQYYQFIELTESEMQLVEPRGLVIERINPNKFNKNAINHNAINHNVTNKKGYLAIIPVGFDQYIFYQSIQNCWYGDKWILGVEKCD